MSGPLRPAKSEEERAAMDASGAVAPRRIRPNQRLEANRTHASTLTEFDSGSPHVAPALALDQQIP